jgi:hypothetical protein
MSSDEPDTQDFLRSPHEPLAAKIVAWAARANDARARRSQLEARHSLRSTLQREPLNVEVEEYARWLYERNDTTLDLSDIPEDELRRAWRGEAAPKVTHGPGRPGWTMALRQGRWDAAYLKTMPPHTYRAVAANFETLDGQVGATSAEYLGKLMRRTDLPRG